MRNQKPRTDQSHCSIQTRYALKLFMPVSAMGLGKLDDLIALMSQPLLQAVQGNFNL